MLGIGMASSRRGVAPWARAALGFLLAVMPLTGLAEFYVRMSPPRDIHPYLAERSPLKGIYVPDDDFGLAYSSWEMFCADNAERMQPLLPLDGTHTHRETWAFFGNSFVQAPGMLADQARTALLDDRVFNLGRNEPLVVRLAQIKLLLEHGMKPARIFVLLMPVDVVGLGEQPLDTIHVTSQGALTYRPRMPDYGFVRWIMQHSQLATTAWVRTGRHRGNLQFRKTTLYEQVDEVLLNDLTRLFANLARVTREQEIPVTILLIPTIHQVLNEASFGFQDTLIPMLQQLGFDVFDPRNMFLQNADPGLFLPDKHFSLRGNQLLLTELVTHVRVQERLADTDSRLRVR